MNLRIFLIIILELIGAIKTNEKTFREKRNFSRVKSKEVRFSTNLNGAPTNVKFLFIDNIQIIGTLLIVSTIKFFRTSQFHSNKDRNGRI